jgi:putative phosphoribosyl transferase
LDAPLDVLVVRKLGVPFQPELAMGALGEGGVVVVDEEMVAAAQVSPDEFAAVQRAEQAQLLERTQRYRGARPLVDLTGKTVIVVDDGIATGSSARAGCRVVRALGANRVILAAPVMAPQSIPELQRQVDELVWAEAPSPFYGVGQWYRDFSQTSDEEVAECLASASHPQSGRDARVATTSEWSDPSDRNEEVSIEVGTRILQGRLTVPDGARGIVLFVHGSGSSRHSPRNRAVASSLNERGLGTLLFDLLTPTEELDRGNVFDIDLLASRLLDVTHWLRGEPESQGVRFGYFGASTGGGAALVAAAHPRADVDAVVSRGGRADLAGAHLRAVRAPTLLIVGGEDPVVLELNRRAQAELSCTNELEVVPGASHLFEEPGTLAQVASLAGQWFERYLLDGDAVMP